MPARSKTSVSTSSNVASMFLAIECLVIPLDHSAAKALPGAGGFSLDSDGFVASDPPFAQFDYGRTVVPPGPRTQTEEALIHRNGRCLQGFLARGLHDSRFETDVPD